MISSNDVIPAPPPAPTAQASPEAAALLAEISKKGEEIRDLKAAKVDKTVLQPHLDALMELKEKLRVLTGTPPEPGTTYLHHTCHDLTRALAGEPAVEKKAPPEKKASANPAPEPSKVGLPPGESSPVYFYPGTVTTSPGFFTPGESSPVYFYPGTATT